MFLQWHVQDPGYLICNIFPQYILSYNVRTCYLILIDGWGDKNPDYFICNGICTGS